MEKEYLLARWLSGEISPEELEALKKLEDLEDYVKIADTSKRLTSPEFKKEEAYQNLRKKLGNKSKVIRFNYWKYTAAAAVIIVLLGVFTLFPHRSTFKTAFAQTTGFDLPDQSKVFMNSGSEATFNADNWDKKREVRLNGEAYFEVAKGKKFDVVTSVGTISVLGTKFNVKDRNDFFEVSCYEGKVQVSFKDTLAILTAGKTFKVIRNAIVGEQDFTDQLPSWTQHTSKFKSIPYQLVIDELERAFDITVISDNIDLDYHFTGEFGHDDLNVALSTITKPLHLDFKITDDKNVTIYAKPGK